MRRRQLLILLLFSAGPAACSSDDERVAPEAFATAVCGSVASWQDDLGTGASELQQRADATVDPQSHKEALTEFLSVVTDRTERLIEDLGGAGAPSGEGGEALAREVRGRAEESRRLFDTARAEAERLPDDDPAAIARGAETIGRTVTEGRDGIGVPLSGPARSPVGDALRREPACRGLTG